MSYFQLGKNLRSLELVHFVSEVIGRSVSLNCQLKFRHNLFVDGYFEGHIADWNFVGKSALYFRDPVSFFGVPVNKSLDLVDGENNIIDVEKYALSSYHIAYFEKNLLFFA